MFDALLEEKYVSIDEFAVLCEFFLFEEKNCEFCANLITKFFTLNKKQTGINLFLFLSTAQKREIAVG